MADANYRSLEDKIDTLISACDRLHAENLRLQSSNTDLLQERALLKEKNEQIRQRVEAMITRLKTLEQDS